MATEETPLIINYGDIKYISKSEIKHEIGRCNVNYGGWDGVNSVINACLSFGPSINYKE